MLSFHNQHGRRAAIVAAMYGCDDGQSDLKKNRQSLDTCQSMARPAEVLRRPYPTLPASEQPVRQVFGQAGIPYPARRAFDIIWEADKLDRLGSGVENDVTAVGITVAWLADGTAIENIPVFSAQVQAVFSGGRQHFDLEHFLLYHDARTVGMAHEGKPAL